MAYAKRQLEQLIDRPEPGFPIVEGWIAEATRKVEVLPASDAAGDALVSLQVTTRSPMGAIVLHTGGLLVDSGWIRILGSGHPRLPRSLPGWNFERGLPESDDPPAYLLVADDVLGGFFALNGGRFAASGHGVWYFSPDTLEWEDMGCSYSELLVWALSGDVDGFYEHTRWPGWEAEVGALPGDVALAVYPFLSCEGPPIAERTRSAVPIAELFELHVGKL